jgi:hypothetical protein
MAGRDETYRFHRFGLRGTGTNDGSNDLIEQDTVFPIAACGLEDPIQTHALGRSKAT